MGAMSLGSLMQARAVSAGQGGVSKDTSLILIWLDGGPSQHDTYDPKPDAPSEYRGIWRHIPTNVPGMDLGELFPLQAKVADKFSIIRSMHHDSGDHFTGGHWMLTGRGEVSGAATAGKYPFIGSIAAKMTGPRKPGMPAHVAVPYASSIGIRPGYFGGNYLGSEHNPFETDGDPNADNYKVANLGEIGGLTIDRLGDRRSLNAGLDRIRRDADRSGLLESISRFDQQAFDLVTSASAREAFQIQSETPETRERYGRNSWGQSVLLARRLVEAGCSFVTLVMENPYQSGVPSLKQGCYNWDSHAVNCHIWEDARVRFPIYDQAVTALIEDMYARGIDKKTLLVVTGEFGRTPRVENSTGTQTGVMQPGRDHWPSSMSLIVSGGGLRMGQVIGSTNKKGEVPKDRPLIPGDLWATVYNHLGIDPDQSFLDHGGRPTPILSDGKPISELI